MKRIGLVCCAAAMMLADPAYAQLVPSTSNSSGGLPVPGIGLGGPEQVDPATAEKRREIERAYRDATAKIPAQATGNDPWANMRGPSENKPVAAPALKTTQKNSHKKKIGAQ